MTVTTTYPTPVIQRIPGTARDWLLHDDWEFDYSILPVRDSYMRHTHGNKLVCRAGITSDMGSVPSVLWGPLLGNPTTYPISYFLHDCHYEAEIFPRDVCDEILYECLILEKAWWIQRHCIYRAVRDCGGFVWDDHIWGSVSDPRTVQYARQEIRLLPA